MEEQDNPKLYRIRHSFAHILAQAVQTKFPGVKLGFGPPTDTGFFYDFDFGDKQLHLDDLKEIEKIMRRIIAERQPFAREDFDVGGAAERLKAVGDESYKQENIQSLHSRGVKNFSFYSNGKFTDLCEGPHVEHTGQLPPDAFKLDRVAGAYWLGSEKNKMLTRIYGLAFENKEQLQQFIKRRETAEEFDHKKLGKELDLFHFDDLIGKGLPLWLPNGTIVRDAVEEFAKEKEAEYGYQRVATPHVTKADLFLKSGHLPAYADSMFPPMVAEDEGKRTEFYLKPMNCPFHHLIYKSRMRSYRDLPMRLAEYGTVYRYEQSGELSGLLRVRCMTMNDAHIYLSPKEFETEFKQIMKMYKEFYDTFKLSNYKYRLSIRGKENADKFQGDPAVWDKAEAMLAKVMDDMGINYVVGEGEGAFYGPKIDFQFKNLMGREETLSTVQIDFFNPKKFELSFIDEQGQHAEPVIIHRAPLSTHERFLSFITEYYGGAFPAWMAPVQVALVPVNQECMEFTNKLAAELKSHKVRFTIDDSDNTFNKKIRNNTVKKTPIMLIIGAKEVAEDKVTVRRYGMQEQKQLGRTEFVESLVNEIKTRAMLREPMGSII